MNISSPSCAVFRIESDDKRLRSEIELANWLHYRSAHDFALQAALNHYDHLKADHTAKVFMRARRGLDGYDVAEIPRRGREQVTTFLIQDMFNI